MNTEAMAYDNVASFVTQYRVTGTSAWTADDGERERFINELESGMVFINKMVASDARIPFGGVKHSGHGRELATNGIREFMNIKTVWIA